jgi:hypothetical protein
MNKKTKLFFFLFLAGSIIPNLLFAQYIQQGLKLLSTGAIGPPTRGMSAFPDGLREWGTCEWAGRQWRNVV